MPDSNTVDIAIPIDAGAAAPPGERSDMGLAGQRVSRRVSRMPRVASVERLLDTVDTISAEAARPD